ALVFPLCVGACCSSVGCCGGCCCICCAPTDNAIPSPIAVTSDNSFMSIFLSSFPPICIAPQRAAPCSSLFVNLPSKQKRRSRHNQILPAYGSDSAHHKFLIELAKKILSGHFRRLFRAEHEEKRWRDIGENAVVAPKFFGVFRHINEMHQIRGMRGIG